MKKWILTVLLTSLIVVSGCGAVQNQKTEGGNQQTVAEQEKNQETEQPKVNLEDIVYTPIDESKYEGMELEMIKLVNLHAKYVNERDHNNFKQIRQSPDVNLPNYKVMNFEILEFSNMKKTQGYVSVNMTYVGFESKVVESGIRNFFIAQNKETKKWFVKDVD
ncbi:hypothetical protein [Paenibacillus agilis]|uniref:Lipoprotein n=1 Tax=Paenibacillus agilis TaxID=3020863 RepID=A0A559IVV3_9BACL|nr:hypothetical protein [Paenibacillus agilis]TVX91759.1 hypothetical protein FPZ44_01005 [Paenibacillus agilis]